jgi:hypothetical protein
VQQPEVWREFSAKQINQVLNHPAVRPDVADLGSGVLDLSPVLANKNNILLMGQYGGCLCYCAQPGLYEVHTQVLPEGRGEWALAFVRAGARWMFTHTGAYEIMTRVSHGNVAAKALTIAAGMRHEFTRDDGPSFRGSNPPCDIYSYRIQDWVQRAAGLVESGQYLHERIQAEAKRLNIATELHADDENHNRYAGAALEMVLGEQTKKAVLFYNRWAVAARHPLIALVSEQPPVIRFDIGLMTLRGGEIEVMQPC